MHLSSPFVPTPLATVRRAHQMGPSAGPAAVEAFTRLLLAMDYADAEVRPLLDLEKLKEWRPGRLQGT